MFKTKERIEKLEGRVLKLGGYCCALEKEQDNIYKALSDGMEAEQAEYDRIMSILRTAIEDRRKAFEAFKE
jgi:hypothetical protein